MYVFFCLGFSTEKTAVYKGLSYWIEFSTSGDTHTAKAQCDLPGAPQQIYTFKIGETIDFISFDGDTAKVTDIAELQNYMSYLEIIFLVNN